MGHPHPKLGPAVAQQDTAADRMLRQRRVPAACSKPIPISAAKDVSERYGYDQIIIIGRSVGPGGREHVTTYGKTKIHCSIAARIGNFLKLKIMGWGQEDDGVFYHKETGRPYRVGGSLPPLP